MPFGRVSEVYLLCDVGGGMHKDQRSRTVRLVREKTGKGNRPICSAVIGSKSMELMLELHRRGHLLAAAAGNCGRPTGQYHVALVDWRRRTLHALEPTMDWLMNFLSPRAVLVVWVDAQNAQKPAANDSLRTSLTKRGFVIVRGAVHECGCALLARRSQDHPVQK